MTKNAPKAHYSMTIVLCADRRVIPGLHVAMFSILDRAGSPCLPVSFHLFSSDLTEVDHSTITATLNATGKPFHLTLHRIDSAAFGSFPALNGSHATYYRLNATSVIDADRFLYLDADTLCDIDLSPLLECDFQGYPAAWTPEAPLSLAADQQVARQLGNPHDQPYFNAGVMLVNVSEWRRQRISERAMEHLATHAPAFHDQSALNIVLHRASALLDPRFNTIANHRSNWPHICHPYGSNEHLIHFVDYPKPWEPIARFIHPQYDLWHSLLQKTAFGSLRAWRRSIPALPAPTAATSASYRKALKDKLLFTAYRYKLPIPIKGIP